MKTEWAQNRFYLDRCMMKSLYMNFSSQWKEKQMARKCFRFSRLKYEFLRNCSNPLGVEIF